jgi:hypothetical protein
MISLICMDQLWIYTCHLRFFTLHCYTSWLPWFWIIMDYLTYYGTWMLKDSSWQAEFSTTGGAAGLGTPPGTQCVLFPVPASLCWFLLQIIDNGVYDATYTIRNNTTIPLYTTIIIQFYPHESHHAPPRAFGPWRRAGSTGVSDAASDAGAVDGVGRGGGRAVPERLTTVPRGGGPNKAEIYRRNEVWTTRNGDVETTYRVLI